ncbi:molybdopterin-dependent oxidoreductase, partial [Escherichia coli]|uniref:molybdopterin-dependent oxidoreductase n=1 Tax=Escherichia coli TaxID=562 RepID=UPI001C57226E
MGVALLRRGAIIAGLAMLLASPPLVAQPAPASIELAVSGNVAQPRTLSLADLQALPPVTLEVAHTTSRGVQRGTYTGPLLW